MKGRGGKDHLLSHMQGITQSMLNPLQDMITLFLFMEKNSVSVHDFLVSSI